jgi:peptidoglycan/LPS O-acetylase OafA/YrhL
MNYRAEVDGLRTFAVLPVILFHAGLSGFSGGFVGVDVFFVISGYLITSVLLRDLETDRFSILKFYERRARRILPALFFVVICSLPFAWIWMLPSELNDFGLSLVGVATFASNILFWQQSSYFAASAELKPMLHTWSLAVEEQYYILFPVFLAALWRYRRNWILAGFIVVSIASLMFAQWATEHAPTANYYLSPMRFWEILAGSICAYLLKNEMTPRSELGAVIGAILVIVPMFFFTAATPTPSIWTIIPVLGASLIILFAQQGTIVASVLSIRIFVSIGLISYSAYLWHQPMIAFYRLRTVADPEGFALAILVVATFAFAYLSWRFIEKPFRVAPVNRFSQKQILSLGTISLIVVAGLGGAISLAGGAPWRLTPSGQTFAEMQDVQDSLRPNAGLHSDCDLKYFATPSSCRTAPSPDIVLWGDSYAMHLAPALVASETKVDFVQVTKSSCGPFIGSSINLGKTRWRNCIEFNDKALAWITKTDTIKTVIVSSAFMQLLHPTYLRDGSVLAAEKVPEQLTANLIGLQTYLRSYGKNLLIISPPPQNGRSLGKCYVRHRVVGLPPTDCDFEKEEMTDRNIRITKILKKVEKDVPVIWFDDFLCGATTCHTAIDQISIYRDSGHLSVAGSTELGRRIDLMGIVQQEISGPR